MKWGEEGGFQRGGSIRPAADSWVSPPPSAKPLFEQDFETHRDYESAELPEDTSTLQGLTIFSDDSYRGSGKSTGLARGLLVALAGGQNLTQDGMGLCSPALKTERNTYFCRSCETETAEEGRVVKIFHIDTRLAWGVLGRPSHALTRFFGRIGKIYMHVPPLQIFLPFGALFRTIGRIRPVSVAVPPIAVIVVEYFIRGTKIEISCRIHALHDRLPRIYLLNELGADVFRAGWRNGEPTDPPPGWEVLPGGTPVALYDPEHRLVFQISDIATSDTVDHRVYWGRERTHDICWAGFEIELEPPAGTRQVDCRYTVAFDSSGRTE